MSTIADVAKLAGVSTGTVSRVMNGAKNVNPDTRSKVEQAISTLGYQPNSQARSLRSKRTDTIALAIPELTNYFWTTVARGVQDASQANDYHVLICNTYARSRQNLRYLESIYNRVDGMILSRRSEWGVLAHGNGHEARQSIDSREKPIVFVGQSHAASWNVDNVYSDSVSGAFALTKHLIQLGRQRIAIVTGRQSSTSASDRVAGYCMALSNANIPVDPDLLCWGEYERKTAERLTNDLLDRQPTTTAIVAANNEIAIGVMQALENRRVSVPDEIAVVCFDDFYPDSRFASMLTVASQSPYDIGVNAAQLLLNRLNTDDYLRPQTVVLPARLIVRQSCGGVPSSIETNISLDTVQGELIAPLPREKIATLAANVSSVVQVTLPPNDTHLIQADKSQIDALKRILKREQTATTAIPHVEYAISSRAFYRYVLEREPEYDYLQQASLISAEDQVDFARRIGLAAIPCRFPFRPTLDPNVDSGTNSGDTLPFDFPRLTDQIDFFDRYVRAARNTQVGIAADFRSIFADTVRTFETLSRLHFYSQTALLQKIADDLLEYQSKVVQLICDRFGADLAFVIFSDQIADESGLCVPMDVFEAVFSQRLQRLLRPVQDHQLPIVLHTVGKIDGLVPLISELGFDAVYVAQPELNDLSALSQAAAGKLSLMGGIPNALLTNGRGQDSERQINEIVSRLAAGGSYVVGAAANINDDVPIKNYFSFMQSLATVKD